MVFSLAQIPNFVIGLLVVLFLFISVVLILTVLIQRPQGGGLSGAFGAGSGSGQTAFGAKTGDALTTATILMFVLWLVTAVGLNYVMPPPEGSPETQAVGTDGEPADEGAAEPEESEPESSPVDFSDDGDAAADQATPDAAPGEPEAGSPEGGAAPGEPEPQEPDAAQIGEGGGEP